MAGNITGYKYSSGSVVSGGRSVIDQAHLQGRVTNGGVIVNPPQVGDVIFEGDVCEYNYKTKLTKCLRVFELATEVSSSATKISFLRGEFRHKPYAGLKIRVATNDLTDKALYITLGARTAETISKKEVYSFVITAGALGGTTIPAGTLFVEVGDGSIVGDVTVSTAGTGYAQNDEVLVVSGTNKTAKLKVATVDTGGEILTVSILNGGTGYAVAATELVLEGGTGTGGKVQIDRLLGDWLVKNPNTVATTDVPIVEVPSDTISDFDGAVYNMPLFNVCTILGAKATPIPKAVKANLRTGYSNILIFE